MRSAAHHYNRPLVRHYSQFNQAGSFFLVVKGKGLYSPSSILNPYIAVYFALASLSRLFTFINIVLTCKKQRILAHTSKAYYLTLLQFCFQDTLAVYNAAMATLLDQALKNITIVLPQYVYTWVDLIRAQGIVSFVIAVPCQIVLLQLRWAEWGELMVQSSKQNKEQDKINLKQALH